jgi:hypothetical protein
MNTTNTTESPRTETTVKCDACDSPATATMTHRNKHLGTMGACSEHAPCLAGWIQDGDSECESDSAAARDFDRRSYGDDY